MRAKEFLTEQQLSQVHDALDVARLSLPNTFRLDSLQNQDFYPIYRFGVAIADVRREEADKNPQNKDIDPFDGKFRAASTWGENQIVSGFDPELKDVVKKALAKVNKSGITDVSTPGSDEMPDTSTISPVKAFRGYE